MAESAFSAILGLPFRFEHLAFEGLPKDRSRCIAEVHPAPKQTFNLKSPSEKVDRRPQTDFGSTGLRTAPS